MPVTRALRELLDKWAEDIKEQWALGNFTTDPMANGAALAELGVLRRIIDIDYEQFRDGVADEKG